MAVLLKGGRNAEDHHGDARCNVSVENDQWADAIDPHHSGRRVADDAARTASVRGRDNRREVADVDFASEYVAGHGAADQRRGDVVEEAR
jgi:hypothetical protein